MFMLTKNIKAVHGLHNDYFILEKRIFREISKLQKKARTDFKKLLRNKYKSAKVRFSSLHDEAYSRTWEAVVNVELLNQSVDEEEFAAFCQLASEKIGITFQYINGS